MSDDIVKRLRETQDDWPASLVVFEQEAADEIEKLRAALKPFADAADDLDEDDKDDWEIWEHWAAMNVKIKHLRAARAAYLGDKDD